MSFRHLRSTLYQASDSDVFRGDRLPGIYMRKYLIRASMVGIEIPNIPVPGTYLTYGACGRYHCLHCCGVFLQYQDDLDCRAVVVVIVAADSSVSRHAVLAQCCRNTSRLFVGCPVFRIRNEAMSVATTLLLVLRRGRVLQCYRTVFSVVHCTIYSVILERTNTR